MGILLQFIIHCQTTKSKKKLERAWTKTDAKTGKRGNRLHRKSDDEKDKDKDNDNEEEVEEKEEKKEVKPKRGRGRPKKGKGRPAKKKKSAPKQVNFIFLFFDISRFLLRIFCK